MAFSTTSLILLLSSVLGFFRLAGTPRERFADWKWLCLWNSLAAMAALGIFSAAIDNLQTTANVRWKRVLIRGFMLLAAGLNAVTIFIVLDSAADMLLRGGGDSSSVVARSACAVVAVAAQLPVVWLVLLSLGLV